MGYRVKRTDANQQEIMDALRAVGYCVYDTHEIGGGFPDIVVGYDNQSILVEVKMPGKKLNEKEEKFFKYWTGSKLIVFGPEDAVTKINNFLRGEYD